MKNKTALRFLLRRSRLGLMAAASLLIYSALLFCQVIPEKGVTLVVIGPAMLCYFAVMGYSGCDIKGGLSPACQFWSPSVIVGSLILEAICIYFVFALIERIFRASAHD